MVLLHTGVACMGFMMSVEYCLLKTCDEYECQCNAHCMQTMFAVLQTASQIGMLLPVNTDLLVSCLLRSIPSIIRTGLLGLSPSVSSVNTPMIASQRCSVSCILVMYGLPRLLAGTIIAHELMHAYLRMRHVTGLPLQLEEGLCQLMAMLWLDSQDSWAKRSGAYQERLASYLGFQIRTDTSHEYGDGFRLAYEAFQQRGLKALVEHVISTQTWPNWAQ